MSDDNSGERTPPKGVPKKTTATYSLTNGRWYTEEEIDKLHVRHETPLRLLF